MKTRSFTKQIKNVVVVVSAVLVLIYPLQSTRGFEVKKNPNARIENSFLVGPSKIELEIPSGASKTTEILIENRTGRDQMFEISFEDFTAGTSSIEVVSLLGQEQGSRSLKNFFSIEKNKFFLSQGDRLSLPVTISIPNGINPGGLYGSLVVSATLESSSRVTESNNAYSGATVLGRVATLFFITVSGDIDREGQLISFVTKNYKKLFFTKEIPFRVEYRNTGDVSLNPYGKVEVTNLFGKKVYEQILEPWFVLPESTRTRDVLVSGSFFGRYTASIELNRGYEDIVDEEVFAFYVVSREALLILAIIGVLVVLLVSKNKISRHE